MSEEFSFVLAKKLKELRKSVCMTQDDVAMLIGMNRTSFSKYENGAANPPLAVLRKLAKLYAVPCVRSYKYRTDVCSGETCIGGYTGMYCADFVCGHYVLRCGIHSADYRSEVCRTYSCFYSNEP